MAGCGLAQDEPLGKPGRVAQLPQGRIDDAQLRHARRHIHAGGGKASNSDSV
jgi:hypothetical protein